eukprot:gnl/MRDRNA2_/MRDRNA2_147498_c0_seq1.p1 gnl/MRDRNA2_/MRDRNA2_147498_c0~~gnl/MRDRNA2_/MRDRNA2_147498_c0_seq1.p1  ORF type:complete len:160 (+),score=37.64 gnl/MRDRNA2_/MRDRNA2_147498_c0_seq1:122-601(+)
MRVLAGCLHLALCLAYVNAHEDINDLSRDSSRALNLLLPPWWIQEGVKPAGPVKDMGTWKASTFSEAQQKQFGIDSNGEVKDKAKFDAAIKDLKSHPKLSMNSGFEISSEMSSSSLLLRNVTMAVSAVLVAAGLAANLAVYEIRRRTASRVFNQPELLV